MDLIVTMDLNHSAFAVVELGAPVGKTFTLGELTRLLRESGDGWDKEDPSAVLRELHEKRRSRPLFVPGEDVPDPVGRPVDFHREVAGRVTQLVEEIAERLFTAGGAKP
jgi:protein-tyrosine-phosphatase